MKERHSHIGDPTTDNAITPVQNGSGLHEYVVLGHCQHVFVCIVAKGPKCYFHQVVLFHNKI